ncbi:MAG: formate dehydrogenase accessory sulfurtransferase FdhD [Chthoniobacteraceae bacterium]
MIREVTIHRLVDGTAPEPITDEVVLEEPLEIRIEGAPLAIAMRTPGQDEELAAGWLLSEGIAKSTADIADIVTRPGGEGQRAAMVDVMLRDSSRFDAARHRRSLVSNASCGLCGAATVDQVLRDFAKVTSPFRFGANLLSEMPALLSADQRAFRRTGGVHACGLFDGEGKLLALREDVGRHNALDKLLGRALLDGLLPLSQHVIFLSGRVSFEMMQKALAAGVPVVAAIGAPSSLAIDLAVRGGQTLVAFVRGTTMNVYAGIERLHGAGRPR